MDINELEARFKEIDERARVDAVDARLEGDTESSSSVNIRVKVKGAVRTPDRDLPPSDSESIQTETLFALDLSAVNVSDDYIDRKIRSAIANKDKFPELPGVTLRQIGATKDYELMEDYTYTTRLGGPNEFSITALTGFIYDRSSIPRIFWALIAKDDLSNVPPLFHDLLYKKGGGLPQNQVTPHRTFVRKDADDLFLELMKKSGVKKWRYQLAYQAVRSFAGFAWQG